MGSNPQQSRLDFVRLVQALRRWGLVVVVGAAVAGLSALLVSRTLPPEYTASAQLYIAPASNPTVAFQDAVLGTNTARSYVQLASTEVVLSPVMERFGWTDLKEFTSRTRASQVRDTSVITISFRDGEAGRAAETANAIAASFIQQTRALQASLTGTTQSQLDTQIRSIEDDIRGLDEQISSLRVQLAASAAPGATPVPRADLQAQLLTLDSSRQTKQQTLAQLLKTRDDMRLSSARADTSVSLWQPAITPEDPTTPRVGLNTVLGAVLGGLFTFVGVLAFAYFEDRLLDPEEFQTRLGISALGQVNLGERPESLSGKLFVRDNPRSLEAEAFRALRTNILYSNIDRPPRAMLVTSALPREGKSVVSANLALAFAQAGNPTVLIDADLRRPSQHRLFGASPAVGLTTVLTEEPNALNLKRFEAVGAANLYVIPSGPLPPNPAELLSSARMTHLLQRLLQLNPELRVVVDSSPVLAAADSAALSTKVDGVVFVVDSTRTRTRVSEHALGSLRRVRATLIGGVLNKMTQTASSYYYYSYYGPGHTPVTTRDRLSSNKRA